MFEPISDPQRVGRVIRQPMGKTPVGAAAE